MLSLSLEALAKIEQSDSQMSFATANGVTSSDEVLRTRIAALLGEVFGPSAHKLRLDQRTFTTPTKRTVELQMVTSNHHVELSPGDAGTADRFVIQDVLKGLASTKNIRSSVANTEKELRDDPPPQWWMDLKEKVYKGLATLLKNVM